MARIWREILVKKRAEGGFELFGRIGLLKEAPTGDEPQGHIIGKRASRGIEHHQRRPEADRPIGHVIAAERQRIEADIDEQGIDPVRGRKMQKRTGKVARQQRGMAKVFDQILGALADEDVIFHDENDGH